MLARVGVLLHIYNITASVSEFPQEGCNKELEWYKEVKKTQGPVEVTSYGQMDNILALGHYRIGVATDEKTIHDAVYLKLDDRRKHLLKTRYSLDELRELESKLVLITGSKAENRMRVDQYLNVCNGECLASSSQLPVCVFVARVHVCVMKQFCF